MSRNVIAVIVAVLMTAMVASLQALFPFRLATPEVAFAWVLYLAFTSRGELPSQVATALIIGYLSDLQSGAPVGIHALSFAVLSMIARAAATRLLSARAWQIAIIVFLASLGHAAVLRAAEMASSVSQMLTMALTTAIAAPIVFAIGRRMDRALDPAKPRSLGFSFQ